MNFLYIVMAIGLGYWMGSPGKPAPIVMNCPTAEKDPGTLSQPKAPAPIVVEPIENNKKANASPTPTPGEIHIDDPSPSPEGTPDNRSTDEKHVDQEIKDISRSVLWRSQMTEVENKLETVTLDQDEYKLIDLYRKKIVEAHMAIVEEREVQLGNYVYQLKVGAANQ